MDKPQQSVKLAYLILGHAHPEHLIRLMEALRPSGSLFVVHIDDRAAPSVFEDIEKYSKQHPDVILTKRRFCCYWGHYNLVAATLECVHTALYSQISFQYAMLISGQDYPIKRSTEIEAFLLAHPTAEFIEAFLLSKPNRWTDMAGPFQAMSKVTGWHLFFRSRALHLTLKRPFFRDWEPFGGSQWWCLSRAALIWVDQYLNENPSVRRYFRFVFIPDESMFQTMIGNSPFRGQISTDLHYIDWDRPNPKAPRTLTDEDFDKLKTSPRLIARKFHPEQSKGLLDRIDRELLQP